MLTVDLTGDNAIILSKDNELRICVEDDYELQAHQIVAQYVQN